MARTWIVLGRLGAEAVKGIVLTAAMLLIGMVFGVRIASGPLGFVLLLVMTAAWGVVFSGFMQLIAMKSRSTRRRPNRAAWSSSRCCSSRRTSCPASCSSRPMEIAASLNPVTYVMEALRSLILEDFDWGAIGWGVLVIVALAVLMLWLNVRAIRRYD